MKLKEFGPGGAGGSLAAPLNLPMLTYLFHFYRDILFTIETGHCLYQSCARYYQILVADQ